MFMQNLSFISYRNEVTFKSWWKLVEKLIMPISECAGLIWDFHSHWQIICTLNRLDHERNILSFYFTSFYSLTHNFCKYNFNLSYLLSIPYNLKTTKSSNQLELNNNRLYIFNTSSIVARYSKCHSFTNNIT